MSKPWWESRTVWVHLLTLAAAILVLPEFRESLPPFALQYVIGAQAVLGILLRILTDTALMPGVLPNSVVSRLATPPPPPTPEQITAYLKSVAPPPDHPATPTM